MNARLMGRRFGRPFAVALVCASLLLGATAPAHATGTEYQPGVSGCLGSIDRRIRDVGKLLTKVANAYDVTAAHRSTLTAALQEAKAGLVALRADVQQLGATTLTTQHEDPVVDEALTPELAAACRRMYTDFRVYVFRQPQVHLVVAADRVVGQRALFDLLAADLDAAIAASPTDPDVGEARRLLDDYRARIEAASLGAAGVSDAIVGLTVADWNANPQILRPYADVMHQAKQDLRTAKKDARKIVALLSDGQTTAKV
jgi:cation diffusion facilitator CzcD-associated flavoprotein CzcO